MAWCIRCKCCEAQSGFILCVFCEDGVPCPNQKRRGPSLALATDAKGAVAGIVSTPINPKSALQPVESRPAKPGGASSVNGVDARQLQRDPLASAPTATQVTRAEEQSASRNVASPRPAEKIPAAAHTGNLQRDRYRTKRGKGRTNMTPVNSSAPGPRNAEGKRICSCGCGTPLVNRHPYIKGHDKNAKPKGFKPSPPRNSIAVRRNGDSAVATICVTEGHLDRFWQNRSLEEKAELFTRYLEGD